MSDPRPSRRFVLRETKMLAPLGVHNFRLLWLGSMLSYLGGQLTLIAFPWLILKVTGDPLAMGSVLAVASVPRALFMVFGGAVTDRFSPRLVMLWVNWLRGFLMFGLAPVIYFELMDVWMVFVVAGIFGVIDAFYWPASSAILPRLLPPALLPAGNSLVQGMGQISMMLGPVIAGFVITLFATEAGDNGPGNDMPGIAVVFLVDGVGFVVAAVALAMIRLPPQSAAGSTSGFARSILEGFGVTWRDMPVRLITVAFTLFSLFFRGPYIVGIPILCDQRFDDGALAFGLIGSAFGAGSLLGLVLAGSLPRLPDRFLGTLILLDFIVLGGSFVVFALAPDLPWLMLASALGGIADGYMIILLVSWLQIRVPTEFLGRVMGVIMVFNQGVAPVSAAAAGALMRVSVEGVFLGAAAVLITLSVAGMALPDIRRMGFAESSQAPR
ncbi:MAG: MFS transporter [Pseudomonadota bacterium]